MKAKILKILGVSISGVFSEDDKKFITTEDGKEIHADELINDVFNVMDEMAIPGKKVTFEMIVRVEE